MPRKIETTANDGEGLTATFTVTENSPYTLSFEGTMVQEGLHKHTKHDQRRADCVRFLEDLFELLNASLRVKKKGQPAGPLAASEDCTLVLEFRRKGSEPARLETEMCVSEVST